MWPWLVIFALALLAILLWIWRPALVRRGSFWAARGGGREDDGPDRPAVLGPDQTNVNPPESYVIHHEGKGQGMDIANRWLREHTRHLTADAPGHTPVPAEGRIPGRTPLVTEHRAGESDAPAVAAADPAFARGDGAAGKRVATADTHMEAAAELAFPYRPAPFVGERRRQFRMARNARAELRGRVLDIAARLQRGPLPSQPGRGHQDPGRHPGRDEDEDPSRWAPLGDHGPCPECYGVDEVVLLPKDPNWVYVYWELNGRGEDGLPGEVRARTRRALRIHDLTCGTWWQCEVSEAQGHRWVRLTHDGHEHLVEVGRAGPGGEWHPLARSRPVRMPVKLSGHPAWAAHLRGGATSPGGQGVHR